MIVLEAVGISVRFGGVTAVDDVSLSFANGEICGIMGPNGAGKTTFFDVLSGVRRPTRGRVLLGGNDVTSRSAVHRSRAGLRRTFQRQQTFGWLSVRDNLLVALESDGGGGGLGADLLRLPSRVRRERERIERVDKVLDLCALTDVASMSASTLDIGRARMVELARALVSEPNVLLLDEPTSGLEERETLQLGATIERLRAEADCAVLLVEHDVGFMFDHCQRIAVLDLGRVIADGTPQHVRADAAVVSAYLG